MEKSMVFIFLWWLLAQVHEIEAFWCGLNAKVRHPAQLPAACKSLGEAGSCLCWRVHGVVRGQYE